MRGGSLRPSIHVLTRRWGLALREGDGDDRLRRCQHTHVAGLDGVDRLAVRAAQREGIGRQQEVRSARGAGQRSAAGGVVCPRAVARARTKSFSSGAGVRSHAQARAAVVALQPLAIRRIGHWASARWAGEAIRINDRRLRLATRWQGLVRVDQVLTPQAAIQERQLAPRPRVGGVARQHVLQPAARLLRRFARPRSATAWLPSPARRLAAVAGPTRGSGTLPPGRRPWQRRYPAPADHAHHRTRWTLLLLPEHDQVSGWDPPSPGALMSARALSTSLCSSARLGARRRPEPSRFMSPPAVDTRQALQRFARQALAALEPYARRPPQGQRRAGCHAGRDQPSRRSAELAQLVEQAARQEADAEGGHQLRALASVMR